MVARILQWSLGNRWLVLAGALLLCLGGVASLRHLALDAIPDLSDVQVIVRATWPGQPPQLVEDQVTYPLSTALLSIPRSAAVRGASMFGESLVYVVFQGDTDPYWARSRVLERLNQIAAQLPAGVSPSLGPDASGVGWVFEYALVDRGHRYDPDQLRALQDSFLRYELQAIPGVAEVATVGGMVRQFQVEVDPNRLAAARLGWGSVAQSIRESNAAGGGSVMEMGRAEYVVRAPNLLRGVEDLRRVVVGAGERGTPIRLGDVAHVQVGQEARRGVTDLDGLGEAPGAIVVMRYGENALSAIAAVKTRLEELRGSLPAGVELAVVYDRSGVIERAVGTLVRELVEESAVVALVCLLFLSRLRSALVIVVVLPLGIVLSLAALRLQGSSANIMSLGGIAIAIGAMVDAAIVMVENLHKHLERDEAGADHWARVRRSAIEVGPTLFLSLTLIAISFLPLFSLTGQEGRLFAPLVSTKTYAMLASAMLAVTLAPVLMGYLVRGGVRAELANPLNRWMHALYRPLLLAALARPRAVAALCGILLASAAWPLSRLGTEFMPPLDEGDLLYMPTTLPGPSIDEAANILQITDRLLAAMPEVERVYGKAGRADSATDPAPLSMLETTIRLKPRDSWPEGESTEALIHKLDGLVRLPGLANSWGYPIRTRIDMLSSGVRSALGIEVTGPDLEGIGELAARIAAAIGSEVPGTRNAFADRAAGGRFIDVVLDRERAARYGVTAGDVQRLVGGAVGGETLDTLVDGRNRYSISMRYPRGYRDTLDALAATRVSTAAGAQVPLGTVARLSIVDGPTEIRSENGRLVGYVYLDVAGRDPGSYVRQAQATLAAKVPLPPGYAISWVGQYRNLQHARDRLLWVVPATLLLIAALLHLHFRSGVKVLLVLLCLPLSLAGGLWLVYWLDYRISIAVVVGFLALAGVAAEFGMVMLLYLDIALAQALRETGRIGMAELHAAILRGALLRIRPKIMTVCVILASLVPVMASQGTGADVMKCIAAPLVGGMITAPLLSLFAIPAAYGWWQARRIAPPAGLPGPPAVRTDAAENLL